MDYFRPGHEVVAGQAGTTAFAGPEVVEDDDGGDDDAVKGRLYAF